MHLGSCLRRLERWEEAVHAFEQVLHADPHRDPIRLELGDCLLYLNRPEQALNCLTNAGRIPRSARPRSARGAVCGGGAVVRLSLGQDEAQGRP